MMNTDKAYLFGLIIGGGIFGNAEDVFRIRLPFRQWGASDKNPQRALKIKDDIMRFLRPLFKSVYLSINIDYEASIGGNWVLLCDGDTTELKSDLKAYGIECDGELQRTVSISELVKNFSDDIMKQRFIAGLVDTIGSMNPNHRNRTADKQTVALHFRGFNFALVCDICRLSHSINCIPNQVAWNHPNIQCSQNPYYASWNKGCKLRILLDQYANFGAYAFRSKAESSNENRAMQTITNVAKPCLEQEVSATISAVHFAEHDSRLPKNIRNGHYLHSRHFCAVLGCEYAPYDQIKQLFNKCGDLVTPFPVLTKDTLENIVNTINNVPILAERGYTTLNLSIKELFESRDKLLYGDGTTTGYPVTKILQGIAYILADDGSLGEKRPKGSYKNIIKKKLADNSNLSVEFRIPDLLTPLIVVGNGKGALIGANNPHVYKRLITFAPDSEYKLTVRPITAEDLRNA